VVPICSCARQIVGIVGAHHDDAPSRMVAALWIIIVRRPLTGSPFLLHLPAAGASAGRRQTVRVRRRLAGGPLETKANLAIAGGDAGLVKTRRLEYAALDGLIRAPNSKDVCVVT
jgi:hypothetical protein